MTEPEEQALVPRPAPLVPSVWTMIRDEAKVLLSSGFLPEAIRTPEQATAIILQGRELGLGPMASFAGINVIRGRPSLSAQLMLALIRRSGLLESIELYPGVDEYTVTMRRKGEEPHAEKFTLDMARSLGLGVDDPKSQWAKQRVNMLKQRALSACARVVFPDVIMGLYTTEEIGGEENHEVVDGEWRLSEAWTVGEEPPPPADDGDFLQRLEG